MSLRELIAAGASVAQVFVPVPLVAPVAALIDAALAADEEAAKRHLVRVMLAAKRVTLKKARGG